jgi:RNA polymerase sigma factor (sigma-70 family)
MNNKSPDPVDAQIEKWYNDYGDLVRYRIRTKHGYSPEDADELTNEVFDRARRSLRGRPESVTYPKPWLLRIADRVCSKQSRTNTGAYTVMYPTYYSTDDGEERSPIDDVADNLEHEPENVVEQDELRRELLRALSALPPEQRQAVMLHDVDGLPYTKIAERSPGRTSRVVSEDRRRGIEQLRERLNHIKY